MSNTINVQVATPKVWTTALTATVATTGVMSLAGNGQHCVYTGTPPTDLIGHRFTGDLVSFSLDADESLQVIADTATTVIITED